MKQIIYIAIGIGIFYAIQAYLKSKTAKKDDAYTQEQQMLSYAQQWQEYKAQCTLTGGYEITMVKTVNLFNKLYIKRQITACQLNWFNKTFYPNVSYGSKALMLLVAGADNKVKLAYCEFDQPAGWNTKEMNLDSFEQY